MLVRTAKISAIGLLLALHSFEAGAQTATPPTNPNFSAKLVVAGAAKNDPTPAWIGLDVQLGSGWHTYWRSAGDAGAPPEFDWSGSQNVVETTVEWPAPHRFSDAGIDTFGYADRVLFPIKVRLRDKTKDAHISLKLALYVCSTICTRNDLQFDADISPSVNVPVEQALIDDWRNKVPRSQSPSLSILSVKLETGSPAQLKIAVMANPPLAKPDVFVDGDSAVIAARPRVTRGYGGASFITLPLQGVDAEHPKQPLHVTLVDGSRSIEAVVPQQKPATSGQTPLIVTTQAEPVAGADAPNVKNTSTWSMIVLSLLGGLVLNFMPCVFPVLSLKLFSVVGHSTYDSGSIRAGFIASAAGIVASFLVLAAGLATLKAFGAQVGWGIQFQQPIFLVGMAAVLAALSANLLGLYEIRLPWWLAGKIGKSTGGQSVPAHFFSGFLITLLATPCSAPFVGTAIAFALSQNSLQIFEIFLGLGIGMALPFLALAAVPQVARLFPRPGQWMMTIKHIAAAAMAATTIWLLTVLAQVSGVQTALFIGTTFGISLWLLAILRERFAHLIAGVLIMSLTGIVLVGAGIPPSSRLAVENDDVQWQPLVPANIQEMVRDGRTVFVDVSAAWCITCKVNEALIINSNLIRKRLTSDVVPFRGDWTKPDDAITAYLQSFGRYGLPFNVVFGPNARKGIVLPELLTQEVVLNAFNSASNRHVSN